MVSSQAADFCRWEKLDIASAGARDETAKWGDDNHKLLSAGDFGNAIRETSRSGSEKKPVMNEWW